MESQVESEVEGREKREWEDPSADTESKSAMSAADVVAVVEVMESTESSRINGGFRGGGVGKGIREAKIWGL